MFEYILFLKHIFIFSPRIVKLQLATCLRQMQFYDFKQYTIKYILLNNLCRHHTNVLDIFSEF